MDFIDLVSKLAPVILTLLGMVTAAIAGVAVGFYRLRRMELAMVNMKIRRQDDYEALAKSLETHQQSVNSALMEMKDEVRSWIFNVSDGGALRYVSVASCQHEQAACYRNISLQFTNMEKKFDRLDDLLTQFINKTAERRRDHG